MVTLAKASDRKVSLAKATDGLGLAWSKRERVNMILTYGGMRAERTVRTTDDVAAMFAAHGMRVTVPATLASGRSGRAVSAIGTRATYRFA